MTKTHGNETKVNRIQAIVKNIQDRLLGYWMKAFGVLLKRFGTDQRVKPILDEANQTIKANPGSSTESLFTKMVHVLQKIDRVCDQALGFFIDDLQNTREEEILERFVKALPTKDFIKTGRTVTLSNGTIYGPHRPNHK